MRFKINPVWFEMNNIHQNEFENKIQTFKIPFQREHFEKESVKTIDILSAITWWNNDFKLRQRKRSLNISQNDATALNWFTCSIITNNLYSADPLRASV